MKLLGAAGWAAVPFASLSSRRYPLPLTLRSETDRANGVHVVRGAQFEAMQGLARRTTVAELRSARAA